jgi:SET domain-containing protein
MVIIKPSLIHGKGVFALQHIKKDIILECDVLEVPKGDIINDYVFPFIGNRVCIHIGFASFLNSSNTPNIQHINIDIKKKISYFKILKDVQINEELTLKYI